MFKWLWKFFRKERPPKEKISKGELERLAIYSCQQVALTEKYVGAVHWEEIDACNEAMQVFMKHAHHYELSRGDLVKVMRTIRKHKWMMLRGRII